MASDTARQDEARAEAERDGLGPEQTEMKVALRGLSDALGINLSHGHGPVNEFTRYVAAVRADERRKVAAAIVAYMREDGAKLTSMVDDERLVVAGDTLIHAADHIAKTWGTT